MQRNAIIARLGIASTIAHAMAQAEVGITDHYSSEHVLECCLREIQQYGFDPILLHKIQDDALSQYPEDIAAMKQMLERQRALYEGMKIETIETKTHGGSSLTWEALLVGPCLRLQDSLGMETGKTNQIH